MKIRIKKLTNEHMTVRDKKNLFIYGIGLIIIIPSIIDRKDYWNYIPFLTIFLCTFFRFFTIEIREKPSIKEEIGSNNNKLLLVICIISLIVLIPFTIIEKEYIIIIYVFMILCSTLNDYRKGSND